LRQNNFNLATQRLASTDDEAKTLRAANSTLKSENAALRDHNTRLHTDLQTAIPSISRLKAYLDNLASHTSSPDTNPQDLADSIEHLHHEWADVDRDFEDLSRRYGSKRNGKNGGVRTDSVIEIGGTPEARSVEGSESGRGSSPETLHRSRIIIKRGGVIRRIEAEPSSSSEGEADEEIAEELADVPTAEEEGKEAAGEVEVEVEDKKSPLEQHGEVQSSEEEGGTTKDNKAVKTTQTPWEELWASIADFAGWHDAYEE
jgi:FtsZ-binding cell division protein ZapB